MDIKKMPEIKNISKIGKEKILLLALAGIMLVGASYFENIKDKKVPDSNVKTKTTSNSYETEMENKVEKLLENINGISKVSVVISFKSGSEKILQEDVEDSSGKEKNENRDNINASSKKSTVIFSGNNGEEPYIVKELYPKVEGIAITAKGISDEKKKGQIINMLSALFDVPIHKISVKKILKKNQIIVTALAVLIAVAGYLNYTDNLSKKEKTKEANNNTYDSVYSQDNISDENGEIKSLDGEGLDSSAENSGDDVNGENEKKDGTNQEDLEENQKKKAVTSMTELTKTTDMENTVETLLKAKGFEDVLVTITDKQVDVIVNDAEMDETKKAQIENVVKRKTGIAAKNITITPTNNQ